MDNIKKDKSIKFLTHSIEESVPNDKNVNHVNRFVQPQKQNTPKKDSN